MFSWFSSGIGAAVAIAISFLVHTVDVNRIEARAALQLSAQHDADGRACDRDKAITKEADDAFAKTHSYSNDQCAIALRMPAKCVPIHGAAGGAKLASARPEHDAVDGLSAGWLHSFGVECEAIRRDYQTCTVFAHHCSTNE